MAGGADAAVQISGPWAHRSVSANGTRFHVAEAGDGPLVLLLHGFPEFWWTWRHQLAWLPEAGFRAVAVDLRGYGGSDKPPRGYDLVTAAADAAGLIRALGEANAIVVGHGWGGLIAWTLAAYYPKVVGRLAVVSMAHPLRMRSAMLTDPLGQGRRSGYALGFQLPIAARTPAGPGRSPPGGPAAGGAGPRRAGRTARPSRSTPAPCGYLRSPTPHWNIIAGSRAAAAARRPALRTAHAGARSRPRRCTCTARWTAACSRRPLAGAGRYVDGPYRWRVIDGAGHFPHEERPDDLRHRAARLAGRSGTGALTRDRDAAGRPRNARPRDALGRPLDRSAARDAGQATDSRRPRAHRARRGQARRPAAPRRPPVPRARGPRGGLEVGPAGRARSVAGPGPDRGRADARAPGQCPRRGRAAPAGRPAGPLVPGPGRAAGRADRDHPYGMDILAFLAVRTTWRHASNGTGSATSRPDLSPGLTAAET